MLIFKIEYCAMDFPTSENDWALNNGYEEIHWVLLEIINRLNIKGIVRRKLSWSGVVSIASSCFTV
jgi:hypothetical protein